MLAIYAASSPSPNMSQTRRETSVYSVRMNATKADAKIPKEYIPEQAVVMTIVTWAPTGIGVDLSPGADTPGTEWIGLLTPTADRTSLGSAATATPEYTFTHFAT